MSTTGLLPHEHVVFTEFDAGEGILVDLNTKKYFQKTTCSCGSRPVVLIKVNDSLLRVRI